MSCDVDRNPPFSAKIQKPVDFRRVFLLVIRFGVTHRGTSFTYKEPMKIPCRITCSRHGIFYYRFQYSLSGQRKESRFSLKTKNPTVARDKSLIISAMIVQNHSGHKMKSSDKDIQALLDGISGTNKALEVVYSRPDGSSYALKADPNSPADLEALLQAQRDFWASELGQSHKKTVDHMRQVESDAALKAPALTGASISEFIERFATRRAQNLKEKTLYEYRSHQTIFDEWICKRKNVKVFPIQSVERNDIADFIDDLIEKKILPQTIQQKYLSAINGLFELAQNSGSYRRGEIPSRGHKIFTKSDAKKTQDKRSWKPYTADDLLVVFDPKTYLGKKCTPTDFWLPFLGLFTGGRISELCQIMVQDVNQINGVWAIAITDEDLSQSLKTPAAKRTIPVHPRLIEVGFLSFVEDMRKYGGLLFPYLTPNAFGNLSETPSERYGKYLDSIGINDKQKVFHSYRSTSNNELKQKTVTEEARCQFIGHEHETTNSIYTEPYSVEYLLKNVASQLDFDLPYSSLIYPRADIIKTTEHKLALKIRGLNHKQAKNKLRGEGG